MTGPPRFEDQLPVAQWRSAPLSPAMAELTRLVAVIVDDATPLPSGPPPDDAATGDLLAHVLGARRRRADGPAVAVVPGCVAAELDVQFPGVAQLAAVGPETPRDPILLVSFATHESDHPHAGLPIDAALRRLVVEQIAIMAAAPLVGRSAKPLEYTGDPALSWAPVDATAEAYAGPLGQGRLRIRGVIVRRNGALALARTTERGPVSWLTLTWIAADGTVAGAVRVEHDFVATILAPAFDSP